MLAVHKHGPETQLLLLRTVEQHVFDMIEFCPAVIAGIINSAIDDPKLACVRAGMNTGDDPDALNHSMRIDRTPGNLSLSALPSR